MLIKPFGDARCANVDARVASLCTPFAERNDADENRLVIFVILYERATAISLTVKSTGGLVSRNAEELCPFFWCMRSIWTVETYHESHPPFE